MTVFDWTIRMGAHSGFLLRELLTHFSCATPEALQPPPEIVKATLKATGQCFNWHFCYGAPGNKHTRMAWTLTVMDIHQVDHLKNWDATYVYN